jgi:hypothetical protein
MHIRKYQKAPLRTGRNWSVLKGAEPETLCGAPVTDKDVRLSDIIRNKKLTGLGQDWKCLGGCLDCAAKAAQNLIS